MAGGKIRVPDVKVVKWVEKKTTRGVKFVRQVMKEDPSPASSEPSTPGRTPTKSGLGKTPQSGHHHAADMPLSWDHTDVQPLSMRTGKASRLITHKHLSHCECQTPNDFMREWLPVRKEYLDMLLSGEGPVGDRSCALCSDGDGSWRCLDCIGRPSLCIRCCRDSHARNPFHRVERWNGSCFTPAWLRELGVAIYLGHGGVCCPAEAELLTDGHAGSASGPSGTSGINLPEDDRDEWDDAPEDDEGFLSYSGSVVGTEDKNGHPMMIIVDRSGVHHLGVHECTCLGAMPLDRQLLQIGIYPGSQRFPKTGFTFAVLDDFLIDNRECKTTALNYYSKLRRITSNAFPHKVPVSDH
jgi:CxC2 like cysteine cluster associated with KDZ transposases